MKACLSLFVLVGFLPALHASAPPNIIYLMADELGYYELGHMGNPNIQTPNIDRLAADGMRFTQALAGSSVCAPTRCTLMTGKHSGHTSVRSNGGGTPLRAGEETIASMLKDVGYATGGFGKWGCGGRGSTGVPEEHGFDEFFGYYDQVHAHSYYPPYLIRNSEEVPLEGNQGGSKGKTYSHYAIYQEAVKFIRSNKDRPFFCYLPFTPPHGLFNIPDDDPAWALYKDKSWPEDARRYAAMVTMVDREVGELLSLLKDLGLDQNTLFFFCGDNGGNNYFSSKEFPRGIHGANKDPRTGVEFRGGKGNLYEGGLRIPMIVHWPGKIQPGQVSDHLWYFPDVLPTLAEISGARAPADIDGLSILPTLLGAKAAGHPQKEHPFLYWEIGNQVAVREKDWKAVKGHSGWELFDLKTDISESHSVAKAHPEVLARLVGYAEAAHVPVEPGTFYETARHERDRQAKMGFPAAAKPVKDPLPTAGVVPVKEMKLVRVSSENQSNQKLGAFAIDGNPQTLWHSRFTPEKDDHPHELVIDLGRERNVVGFLLLPRQDGGVNGMLKEAEFYVSNNPQEFISPVTQAAFPKSKDIQTVSCRKVRGRYVKLRTLSEQNDQSFASLAEFRVKLEE